MYSGLVVDNSAIQCYECAYLNFETGVPLVNDLFNSLIPWNDEMCLENPGGFPLRTCEHPSQTCVAFTVTSENTAEALGFRE